MRRIILVSPCARGRQSVWDAFSFPSQTSRGDPRRLRRAELAHRLVEPCAPFWNSLSHGCTNRESSVSSSFPPRLSRAETSPLRPCSSKREGIPWKKQRASSEGSLQQNDARTFGLNQ